MSKHNYMIKIKPFCHTSESMEYMFCASRINFSEPEMLDSEVSFLREEFSFLRSNYSFSRSDRCQNREKRII